MKNGIAVLGTALLDKINVINKYPNSGELTQIVGLSKSVGGLVPNVGIDIKKIDKNIPVHAIYKIGEDADGEFITNTLSAYGLNVSGVKASETENTSFTNVMSVSNGERTFFTYAGACATFGVEDIDFDNLNVDMMHLGYFLLLDKVDNGDGVKILKKAKEKGIKTSIDLVSENSNRYSLVVPCLKYVDNLIINEVEGGNLTGIQPKRENLKDICTKLKSMGVAERVIIHMPEVGACLSDTGYTEVNSFMLPKGYIAGSTGAGDAFCAGSLVGIYKGYSDKKILEFASSCAAVSLRKPDAVSGMMSEREITEFCSNFSRR